MNYNDELTAKLLNMCQQHNANAQWFWLVHVFGTLEDGFMCLIEGGERYYYKEFTQDTFTAMAEAFAKDIPDTY